jgi:hypothetical protein
MTLRHSAFGLFVSNYFCVVSGLTEAGATGNFPPARSFQRLTACSGLTPNGPAAQQLPHLTASPTSCTWVDPQYGQGFSSGNGSIGNTRSFISIEYTMPGCRRLPFEGRGARASPPGGQRGLIRLSWPSGNSTGICTLFRSFSSTRTRSLPGSLASKMASYPAKGPSAIETRSPRFSPS